MMKLVVATVTGIILCISFMYFMFPLLTTEHSAALQMFNSTDPTIAFSYQVGGGFYNVIPFLPILAGLFIIFAYALRRSQYE